ncbi:MAG: hypothetical protein JWQ74_717 [Marmoricola sp.]|nr:hypothetical protein [Marmoricola sp.]
MATLPQSFTAERPRTARAVALLAAVLGLATLVVPASVSPAVAAGSKNLVGTLQLRSGACSGGAISGTYLRMILPSGGARGPYMSNSDSTCPDQSFTPLSAGSDGGLRFGSYQTTPSPRFGSSGDAKARRITAPAPFYGTSFATATSKVDPQTRTAVPAPSLTVSGTRATADLRSFAVTWNNQDFNQGAPKPNGSTPGNTKRASGTYDAATGRLTLEWASQVVGGPFDKFTGFWHLEGTFVPAAGSAPAAQQPAGGTAAGAAGGSGVGSSTTGGSTTTGGTAAIVPGAAPTAAGTATRAAKPGAPAGVTAAAAAPVAAAPATTKVVTTQQWHVSTPVISLAIAIALVGLAALAALTLAERRAKAKAAA